MTDWALAGGFETIIWLLLCLPAMHRGVNYRQSLPGSSASMTPVTPLQLSSRKRKRGLLDELELDKATSASSEVRFHEEDEYDAKEGKLKKVIVIDDDDSTPEPSPPSRSTGRNGLNALNGPNGFHNPLSLSSTSASTSIFSTSSRTTTASYNGTTNINGNPLSNGYAQQRAPARTRAQVAAASAAATAALKVNAHAKANANSNAPPASFQPAPPPPKRRRRDQQAVPSSALSTRKPFPQITNKPWPSTSTDAVRLFGWIYVLLTPITVCRFLCDFEGRPRLR